MGRLEELRWLLGQMHKYPIELGLGKNLPNYFEALAHDGLVTGLVTAQQIAALLDEDERK